jgi:hypothetical protein
MLPSIVIYLFLNNQPDAPIILNLHETYQFRKYSRKRLTVGREDARNM